MSDGIRKAKSVKVITKLEKSPDYVLMMYTENIGTESKYMHMHRRFMYRLIEEFNATGKMTLPDMLKNTETVISPVAVRFFEDSHGYASRDAQVAWTEGEEQEPKDVMATLEWTDYQQAWYDKQVQEIAERARGYGFLPKKNK
jgi:hypothetical protein